MMAEKNTLNEKQVTQAWESSISALRKFTDTQGRPLEVVYPGMLNNGRGGDYRDAVIKYGKRLHRGSIEIHTFTSGWRAHGHHLNPDYNETILHVAAFLDSSGIVLMENGSTAPTIIIGDHLKNGTEPPRFSPCSERKDKARTMKFIEAAGRTRFRLKTDLALKELKSNPPEECLYGMIMEALGYSSNKPAFRELADCLPLKTLSLAAGRRQKNDSEWMMIIQSLLLGSAGLLPSQRHLKQEKSDYIDTIEQVWQEYGADTEHISAGWELYKIRPGNHPVRRIIAASYLAGEFLRKDLFSRLSNSLYGTERQRVRSVLSSMLVIPSDDQWLYRYDFGKAVNKPIPTLLGAERAADIIVNVILPFFCALYHRKNAEEKTESIFDIFAQFPPSSRNSIEKHMLSQLNLNASEINTALRQQGLLHIYKTLCSQGNCGECGI